MNVYLPALCLRLFALATMVATGNALMVAPVSAQQTVTQEFCNTSTITIPSGISSNVQASRPYPSPITTTGNGVVVSVTATVKNFTHRSTDEVDILLSGPNPAKNVVLFSDIGGEPRNATLTFDDNAGGGVPRGFGSGTYRPTNRTDFGRSDNWPGAPAPSGATTMSTFKNSPGAGTWNLWVVDDSGNDGGSIAGWCVTVTTGPPPPTVTVNQAVGQVDPAAAGPILFDIQFSEAVTGLTGSDFVVGGTAGGTKAVTVTGSVSSYTASVAGMTTAGTVTLSLPDGAAQGSESRQSAASTSTDNQVTYSPPAPTVTVNQAVGQLDPAISSPILFDVVFDQPVTGLAGSDFVVGGIAGGNKVVTVTGSGTTYTASVAGMTAIGTVTLTLPAGRATSTVSAVGNAASTSTDNTVIWLPPSPTVTVEQDATQTDPATSGPISFDVQFSEDVNGLEAADFSTTGSTSGGTPVVAVTGSGSSYTATVSGMATPGTVVLSLPAGAATSVLDTEGNEASTSIDNEVTFAPPPTVTVNQAAGQADPAEVSPIGFDIVFSEAVTGLTGADFVVSGTAGGNKAVTVSGSGTSYTALVAGMTTPGSVVLTLPADRAATQAGTSNAASTSTDNTVEWLPPVPTVTVEQDPGQADPTSAGPIVFDVQFSEPVTGLIVSGLTTLGSTAGGTLVASLSGSGASYRVEVTGMTTPGTVVLTVLADSAFSVADGEGNALSTSSDNEVTYAPPAPTVTVEQAAGQVDPATAGPIEFDIVFSEAVTDLAGTDFVVEGTAGGTKTVTVSSSGTTYTASVTGMTTPGTVLLALPAGAAQSTVSTVDNTASTSTDNIVTWSPPPPTVAVEQAAGQADPATTGPIQFTVTFSEPVTGLDAADISTDGSTVSGTAELTVTGSGDTYTVSVSGMRTSGTVVLSLPEGAAQAAASTVDSEASTSTDNTVTFALPTPQAVPALSAWGLFAAASVLAVAALVTLRHRLVV